MIRPETVLKLLGSPKYKPMKAAELAAHFNVPEEEYDAFGRLLAEMQKGGEIVQVKQRRYASPKKVNLMVGRLQSKPDGYGFVVPVREEDGADVFVDEKDMRGAMHGDLVVVRRPKGRRGRRPSGQIVDIIERANPDLVGTFAVSRGVRFVVPDQKAIFRDVYVGAKGTKGAKPGDKVIVRIVEWPTRHLNAHGVVQQILGRDGEAGVDEACIIHQFHLPHVFSRKAAAEAEALRGALSRQERDRRVDTRSALTVTIDPEDAKDHDDAFSLTRTGAGWRLGVHIADVSHYVRPDNAIDEDARERGTSVYLPGTVVPMLPEKLATDLCSLRQGKDRLAKSVFFDLDREGHLLSSQVERSVIRVDRRLTYQEAADMIRDGRSDDACVKLLKDASVLTTRLVQLREARGALDLALPEVHLHLKRDGSVKKVEKVERNIAHHMVEEFMLLANEAVAKFLRKHKLPYLCRAHPSPDPLDLKEFSDFVKALGLPDVDASNRKSLQRLLRMVRGRSHEFAVNYFLLRSLKQAYYCAEPVGHDALALRSYTHFTSPIRRYPDLIVHQILDQHWDGELKRADVRTRWTENMAEWAEQASKTERRAEEAERELTKLKILRYLQGRQDETFSARVTGVQEYGLFVMLEEFLVEGLVHIRTLVDDFYSVENKGAALVGQRRGHSYCIGDILTLRIDRIDVLKREIDFVIVDRTPRTRKGKGKRRRRS